MKKRSIYYEVATGTSGVVQLIRWQDWKKFTANLKSDKTTFSFKKIRKTVIPCSNCNEFHLPETFCKVEMNGNEYEFCARCFIDEQMKRLKYIKTLPAKRWQNDCETCSYCGQLRTPVKLFGLILGYKTLDIYGHHPLATCPTDLYAVERKRDSLLQSKYPELFNDAKALWNKYCVATDHMDKFLS